MAKNDDYKENFRTDMDPSLEKEINDALGGMSIDQLVDGAASNANPIAKAAAKGQRRGRIARIDLAKNEVLIDFGGKDQGVCPFEQFKTEPALGQEMDFTVVRRDPKEDILIVAVPGSKTTHATWDTLQIGQIIDANVTAVVDKGLELDVKGMRGFMPVSQIDLSFVKDTSVYLNQRLTCEVVEFNARAKKLILSRRNILEQERAEARKKMLAEIEPGQTHRGTVRSVMDFGAFVDLGGLDGLLHVSEMSYKRVKNPAEMIKVGDVVDVKILKIDRETGKLSLSLKQAMPDPWLDVATKYPVGTSLTGLVARVEAFGAFIELEPGLEGLLPVSEISFQRIKHPSDVVKVSDTVKLVVISLDAEARRMSLSMKQAGPDPWKTVSDRYAVDMVVTGKVTRTADFGAFVELEPGLEGLIHVSELSNQRVRTVTDVVKPGQEVQVAVLDVDKEHRRLSLSIKRVSEIQAPAAATPVAGTDAAKPAAPRKPLLNLRGGLDFDFKKNK